MSDLVPAGQPPAHQFTFDSDHGEDLDAVTAFAYYYSRRGDRSRATTAPYGLAALLAQTEWWRPQVGPPLRVVEMTDTHRLHTARFVLNRATSVLFMHPEQVKTSPLFGALLDGLPRPGGLGWDDLVERTTHWSTCPRNRSLAAPTCSPDCKPRTEAHNAPRELFADYNGDAAGRNGL